MVMGFAIFILTIFVCVYGVSVFYDRPDYDDFCVEKSVGVIESESDCLVVEGRWSPYDEEVMKPRPVDGDLTGWCDVNYNCRLEYESESEKYARNIFFIALPLGILLILLGAFVFGLESVGAGIMAGGVGVILWGVGGYWQYSDNVLKFLLSLVGLVIVIFFAYRFNGHRFGWKKK